MCNSPDDQRIQWHHPTTMALGVDKSILTGQIAAGRMGFMIIRHCSREMLEFVAEMCRMAGWDCEDCIACHSPRQLKTTRVYEIMERLK